MSIFIRIPLIRGRLGQNSTQANAKYQSWMHRVNEPLGGVLVAERCALCFFAFCRCAQAGVR
jgi:hypothetical protein